MKGVGAVCSSSSSSPLFFFSSDHFHSSSSHQFSQLKFTLHQKPTIFTSLSSTSSSSSIVEQEEQGSSSLSNPVADNDNTPDPLPFSGCKGCGREQIESGCNGEGRIQGGIATIPGFGWWPIKAYRPCPGFLASGGSYRRRGQSLDEVAFGRGKPRASMDDFDDMDTRKKGKNRKQFKS